MFSSFVQNSFELVPSISFAINAFYLTWLSRLRSHTASAHKMKITDYKKRFGADPELLEVVFHRYKKLVQLTISQQRCGVCIFASKYNCIRILNTKVQCLYLCLYLYSIFVLVSYRTYLPRQVLRLTQKQVGRGNWLNPVCLKGQLVCTCEEVADARANAEHPAVEAETGFLGHLGLINNHFDNFVLAEFPPGRPSCRSSKPRTG